MLDGQRQRLDVFIPAGTAHDGLSQKTQEGDLCLIIPLPRPFTPNDPFDQGTEPNRTTLVTASCIIISFIDSGHKTKLQS